MMDDYQRGKILQSVRSSIIRRTRSRAVSSWEMAQDARRIAKEEHGLSISWWMLLTIVWPMVREMLKR